MKSIALSDIAGRLFIFHADGARMQLHVAKSVLLVIDAQEKLVPTLYDPNAVQRMSQLVRGAQTLGVPVLYSEQYPQGLGTTVAELRDTLGQATRFEKLEFSCLGNADFRRACEAWIAQGRTQWVVCGIETHICVAQTASDLTALKTTETIVAEDACASRTERNHRIGVGLMERDGAAIASVEAILFAWLKVAGGPHFKTISQLIR